MEPSTDITVDAILLLQAYVNVGSDGAAGKAKTGMDADPLAVMLLTHPPVKVTVQV